MSKASGSIDLKSVGAAAKTATNYMEFDSTNGLRVSQGKDYTKPYVQIVNSGINIFKTNTDKAVIDTDGMKVYKDDASNPVAQFGITSYIGKHDGSQSYLQMDYHSLQMIDKELNSFFEVKDLRETNGVASISERFVSTNDGYSFPLSFPASGLDSVQFNGSTISSTYYSYANNRVTLRNLSSYEGEVQINYSTTSNKTKYFTLGARDISGSTILYGGYSVAEGFGVTAGGAYSHAEGLNTKTFGNSSHAEGWESIARGVGSHAEGYSTEANGSESHAEGWITTAKGTGSHAEGSNTNALGMYSHTQNYYTVATESNQTVIGKYNAATVTTNNNVITYSDVGNYAFIIGNGSDNTTVARSNALTVDWFGNLWVANNITVTGSYYTKSSSLSLGSCVVGGYITNNSGSIVFSIPTGRVYPTGTTINTISFNIVARAGNSNSTGTYIIKSTNGGSSPASFSSTTSSTFYNGANVSKTLTTAMWRTKELHGGTNIYLVLGTDDTSTYLYSSSSINSQINNQPLGIYLGNIQVTFNIPA